jgi:tRNA nucleotidyltransferase/poly(A) polymerase
MDKRRRAALSVSFSIDFDITIGKETLLLNNIHVNDLKNFERQIPALFQTLIQELGKKGYIATAVGGIVRDYFLDGRVGKDWDLEITHPTLAWEIKTWKELGKELSKLGRVTFLPYDVIRLEEQNLIFELSPPRKESFTDENHHKNFTVNFDFRTPFEEAVERRDFTINAMGFRFDGKGKPELVDPLQGLRHLREKELHACGEDFSRDPVRFLRAIRFSVKLGFKISPVLQTVLTKMNVQGISPSYFWSEMQKSADPVMFYRRLLEEKTIHPELPLPTSDIRPRLDDLKKVLVDPSRHESWIMALEWEQLESQSWQKFFGLSSETCRRLERWTKVTHKFIKIFPEEFHGDFEEVRERPIFEELFDWYFTTKQILQKNPELPLTAMIESYLPQWIHLYKFEAPRDVKHIDPPFRAKYQVWNLCQRL